MLGCKPEGRFTEQHDIFFGIGNSLPELIPQMKAFWPEAKGKIHIDAWREVTVVDNHSIAIVSKTELKKIGPELFFINLGGYKQNEFEEYHYKILSVGDTLAEVTKKAKKSTFYKHVGFKGATSHIDDKYGVDVDDIYEIADILTAEIKEKYCIHIEKAGDNKLPEDNLHLGYFKLSSFD